MTVQQLIQHINSFADKSGVSTPLPQTLEVDSETYANVCQFIFNSKVIEYNTHHIVRIILGEHNGIKFKDVELILKKDL